ncbi:hypothetical protein ARMSODRAFT_977473 [Armillaria solidipes]|uniref:Uncharacterized protein n=1 Tax=Armillaria solidipes TaxID=1076256 RepID=A0A2H3B6R6_9AGAR|nr:hypothetical protein ARMSODRAFT_977473 [Armillaria solidipes]
MAIWVASCFQECTWFNTMTHAYLRQIFRGLQGRSRMVFDNENVDELTGKGNGADINWCMWQASHPIIFTCSLSHSNHAAATQQPTATQKSSDPVLRIFTPIHSTLDKNLVSVHTGTTAYAISLLDATQLPLYIRSCREERHGSSRADLVSLPERSVYPWFLSRQDEYMVLDADYKEDWFIKRVFDQLVMQELRASPQWNGRRYGLTHGATVWSEEASMTLHGRQDRLGWGDDDPVEMGPLDNLANDLLHAMPLLEEGTGPGISTITYSNFQPMPKGQNKRPPFVYTDEQHRHLHKKAVFHAKAKNSRSPFVLQRFLDAFFMEWFLLYPEDTSLSGFELEATQHFQKKDLLKMLPWAYWMSPFTAQPTDAAVDQELNEARILRLSQEAQPAGVSSLSAQIQAAVEERQERLEAEAVSELEALEEALEKVVVMAEVMDADSPTKTHLRHSGATPTGHFSDPVCTTTFYAALDTLKDLHEEEEREAGEDHAEGTVVDFF